MHQPATYFQPMTGLHGLPALYYSSLEICIPEWAGMGMLIMIKKTHLAHVGIKLTFSRPNLMPIAFI